MIKSWRLKLALFFAVGVALLAFDVAESRAAAPPLPNGSGTCQVVEFADCTTADPSASVDRVMVQKNDAGVFHLDCSAKTAMKPRKTKHCVGEGGTEPGGTHPCTITISGVSQVTDDWTQDISPSGNVHLQCHFDPNEQDQ